MRGGKLKCGVVW